MAEPVPMDIASLPSNATNGPDDHLGWANLRRRVFADPLGPPACWFAHHVYEPSRVIEAGADGLGQAWPADEELYNGDEGWIEPLIVLAKEMHALSGDQATYLDYTALAAEVRRSQHRLADRETDAHFVLLKVIPPLYRKPTPAATWRP